MRGEAFGLRPMYVHGSGDCPDCNADTELARDPDHPGVWRLNIRHDDTCPTYRRLRCQGRAS